MSRWFRMYDDVLDDPKVQKLPPALFKHWVNLLCLASRNDGKLPGLDDIAFALRLDENVTRDMLRDLVQRGLIDECDGLSPHNWAERQFKSDKDTTAAERKRKQRAREKEADVTPSAHGVTQPVTRDDTEKSQPPEQIQNRAEQSRADARAHTEGDKIPREVQGYLDKRADDLTHWEVEFLVSIKWADSLSKAQMETLKSIREKLAPRDRSKALPSVKRGSPAYDAWIAYYRKRSGGRPTFHERQDALTVPSEFPPAEQAA